MVEAIIKDRKLEHLSKKDLSGESRDIPPNIKKIVWERDEGRCRICKSEENLEFDHILPFSKGGTSNSENNIQLLCINCNRSKSNKIE